MTTIGPAETYGVENIVRLVTQLLLWGEESVTFQALFSDLAGGLLTIKMIKYAIKNHSRGSDDPNFVYKRDRKAKTETVTLTDAGRRRYS